MRIIDHTKRIFQGAENYLAFALLVFIAMLPAIEVVLRMFSTGVRGSSEYVQHLVLCITFIGGMITSRQDRHITLSALSLVRPKWAAWLRIFGTGMAAAVCATLSTVSFQFAREGFDADQRVGFIPLQWILMIMPVGFAVMGLRAIMHVSSKWRVRLAAAAFMLLPFLFRFVPDAQIPALTLPCCALLIAAALCGAPIFIMLGGCAAVFFFTSGGSVASIPNQAYTMLTRPAIPTIPLFAFAGFILSEGKSGERLVRFFQALFGCLPGGLAIMAILVCAFFTTFTGASGVTILALGGLLSYMLAHSGYRPGVSTGLITAAGSIGLLFPPSLPVILYGVVAHVNIITLFKGGLLPGMVLVAVLSIMGIRAGMRNKVERTAFDWREVAAAARSAAGELLLPVFIIILFFTGATTMVETGAIAVCYALVLEALVHHDFRFRDMSRVALACLPIIGGVLIILAAANGLSYYLVDAEVPVQFAAWMQGHVSSKYVFLLLLNAALLITGCFMDIFSATIVVVPLIIPLAEVYGVHPVHLGIIFLANLELGYLAPPVGINLVLASYRFNQPLINVYKNVLPYLIALAVAVLLITYVPWLTMWAL